jgi:cyclic-di-GMP phosphodiesterase TipF (flagellum assembly factor)
MAIDTSKEQRKPAKKRAADGLVMMAMAIVTLALCMGLVAQVGLSFWLAVTVSVAFYIGLLTLHMLVRRYDQLDELRAEVDRLTSEVARLSQNPAAGGRMPAPLASGPAARIANAKTPSQPPTQGPAPAPTDPLARVAAAMSPPSQARKAVPGKSEEPASTMPAEETLEAITAQARQREDKAPAQLQKIVRAPQNVATEPMPTGSRDADMSLPMGQAATMPPPKRPPALSQSAPARQPGPGEAESRPDAAPEISHTRRDMAAERPLPGDAVFKRRATSRGEESAQPAPQPDAIKSDAARVPPLPASANPVDGMAAKMSAKSDMAAPSDSDEGEPSLASGQPDAGAPWLYRPGDASHEAAFSPSESDVEMIQGLIKKLADEVNSTDAARLAVNRSRETQDAEALDRSVGALRQAARYMQEPARRGKATKSATPPPRQPARQPGRPAPDMNEIARPARPVATQAKSDSQSNPPSTDVELDVETLMRRAQPIASMTSMPPPLPAAPNIMDKRSAGMATPEPEAQAPEMPVDADDARRGDMSGLAAAAQASADDDLWGGADEEAGTYAEEMQARIESRLARIADAIEAGRVNVFLEPILDLEKNQARHYEVSVRLTDADGAEISPDDPIEAERPSGAMPLLDGLRLKRTADVARRLEERNKAGNVFSSFSGQSLTADEFLSTFAETYDTQVQLANQLVLTFSQADVRLFRNAHWTMVNEMRDLGFGFALRAVTDLDIDFDQLARTGFRFVKLDADVFLQGLPAPGALIPADDLCKHLEDLGLKPVVEALDDEDKRTKVFTYGVRLGQGRLFGGARQFKAAQSSGPANAAA